MKILVTKLKELRKRRRQRKGAKSNVNLKNWEQLKMLMAVRHRIASLSQMAQFQIHQKAICRKKMAS